LDVRFRTQELVNQVSVGSVKLDTIEASGPGIGSSAAIVLDRAADFRQAQGSGLRNIDKTLSSLWRPKPAPGFQSMRPGREANPARDRSAHFLSSRCAFL
jgi:hypothetical protein